MRRVLTALVIVAWKFGGGGSATPSVHPRAPAAAAHVAVGGLQLTGVKHGTYVEVRRGSSSGAVLELDPDYLRRMLDHFESDGKRFWLYVRRVSGVRVSIGGKAVALPAGHNLKVLVTPTRTARAGA